MRFRKPAAAPSARGKTLKSLGKAGVSSSIATGRVLGDVRAKPTFGSSNVQMVKKGQHGAASGARRWMRRRGHVEGNDCSKSLMGGLQRRVAPAAISDHLSAKDADLCAGHVQETDVEHSRRHPPQHLRRWASTCARCAHQLWLSKTSAPSAMVATEAKIHGRRLGIRMYILCCWEALRSGTAETKMYNERGIGKTGFASKQFLVLQSGANTG